MYIYRRKKQQFKIVKNRLYNSNNRAVINEFGVVQQVTNYYPFGGVFSTNGAAYAKSPDAQPYKYNGKELDRTHGLDWYDYGARNYDAPLCRWHSIDPLCEKYYNISPYAYCANNPVMLIDPDGREVYISGSLANMAVQQLQAKVGKKIQLSLSSDNKLCYNVVGKGRLNKSSQNVIKFIDDSNITVNLITTDKNKTSTGNLFIGGAFMGNNVKLNTDGDVVHTTAYQEVNPQVLEKADTYAGKGTFVMHELSEAYEGAKLSVEQKTSSPNSGDENSVYKTAHKKATYQPAVYTRYYDRNGNVISTQQGAVRVEWYVKPNNESTNETIIQTIP